MSQRKRDPHPDQGTAKQQPEVWEKSKQKLQCRDREEKSNSQASHRSQSDLQTNRWTQRTRRLTTAFDTAGWSKGGGEVTRSNGRKRASRKTETAAWIKILRSQRRCLELVIGKLGESLHVFHARTTKVLTGLVGPCSWLWASQVSSHLFTDVPTEARRATCLTLGEVREHPSHTTTLGCFLPFTLPVGKREHCWLKPIGESTLLCLRNFTPLSFLM